MEDAVRLGSAKWHTHSVDTRLAVYISLRGSVAQDVRPILRIAFQSLVPHTSQLSPNHSLPQLFVMFICSVLVCLGCCHGCGPAGVRALPRPDVQGTAMDFPMFHRFVQKEKREPRHPAATPIATVELITDQCRQLFGDLTEVEFTRSTMVFFFPPS